MFYDATLRLRMAEQDITLGKYLEHARWAIGAGRVLESLRNPISVIC